MSLVTNINIPIRIIVCKFSMAASGILSVQIPDSFIQVFPRQPVVGSDARLECFAYGR